MANAMAKRKAAQEKTARQLAEDTDQDGLYRLMTAVGKSVRLVNEDLLREAGYMLPQSGNTHRLLEGWVKNPPSPGFPVEAAEKLLKLIPCNDKEGDKKNMSKWKCKVCGYIYEGEELPADFTCPICHQPASSFEKIEESKSGGKYAGTQTQKNLEAAFAGESQARNKYTYFSSVAKKEGYEQIAALFLKTAENEREHAKMWFKELNGIPKKTCCMPLRERTTNGPICTTALPRPRKRKAFLSWPPNSVWWRRLKSTMRSVIAPCFTTSKWRRSLLRARSRYGNAVIAAIL